MLQPQLRVPLRVLENIFSHATRPKSQIPLLQPRFAFAARTAKSPVPAHSPFAGFSQVRYASHASQGSANAHSKNRPGKRLGAKKTGEQYVIPGNIIFRQRGTKWFPGENCGMGRDHTIYATVAGYVKYYRDPLRHPDRRYIGVAFERDDVFPSPKNAPTKRRLGMFAAPRQVEEVVGVEVEVGKKGDAEQLPLRPGYQYRQGNWEIGRAADRALISVADWRRKDRWTAWRKKAEKIKRVAQMKDLKSRRKGKAKARK